MDTPAPWIDQFNPREQFAIDHARLYAQQYDKAGIPGHNQYLLIAKLADALDARERVAMCYTISRSTEAQ